MKHPGYWTWQRVRTEADAEKVRILRNECRLFMTKHTEEISTEEQRAWFFRQDPTTTIILLFKDGGTGEPVGYGLARLDEGWILSGGVTAEKRGFGIGRRIFETLIEVVPSACTWLEVREDNVPAKALYEALGFRQCDEFDRLGIGKVLSMVRDPK